MKNWSLPKLLIASIGAALVALLAFSLVANFIFANNGSDVEEPTAQPSPTLTREGDTGKIKVVTSTRVWAEITELLGTDWVEVVTLVPEGQDPHSYQATARDQLSISEAELVIANGGGYDDFMDQLVDSAEGDRVFLKLVEGEHSHSDGEQHTEGQMAAAAELNEHIWYDFELTLDAAELIVEAITELRPEAFESVSTGFDFFSSELANLGVRLEALRERALGLAYIAPEGVANLMLENAGLDNLTPDDLAEAIEEDREVSLGAITEAEELLSNRVVELLVINISSTPDSVTERLIAAAEAGNREIVRVSESGYLDVGDGSEPEELSYLDWMARVIDQLQEAIY
jgi:zinc/manganese transport system substrate-binding protein